MSRLATARRLRRNMTEAEAKLRSRLRNRQMRGVKFRRQQIIEGFVADFGSVETRLVIEVDGGQHAAAMEADRIRSEALAVGGYLVLRFWNDEVLRDIDAVLTIIDNALADRPADRTVSAHRHTAQPLTLRT